MNRYIYFFFILTTIHAANAFSTTPDWNKFRQSVINCPQSDAHCVGLSIIDAMQEVYYQQPNSPQQIRCSCANTTLSCYLRNQSGQISKISGSVTFSFQSKCIDSRFFAERKGAFCDDGRGQNGFNLWLINQRSLTFERFASYTFERDCEDALAEF